MPFIPVENTAAVHVRGLYYANQTENVLYYKFPTQPTTEDLEALCTAIVPVIVSNWITNLPPAWVGREVYARDLTTTPSAEYTDTTILGEVGSYPDTEGEPGNVTIALQRSSGLSGRGTRGRIFWQGIPESQVAGNYVAGPFLSNLVAALELTDAAAVVAGWLPVIVSLYEAGLPRSAGVTYDLLTWKWVDNAVDSMRRRLAGRGS